jgi:hypothetical protein
MQRISLALELAPLLWESVPVGGGSVPAMALAAGRHVDMPETAEAAGPTCPNGDERCHLLGHMPALTMAAPSCRRRPTRHVPHIAWPGVPPLSEGPFWQIILEVVFFVISLVQVASCVKNSLLGSKEQI